jgi:hypothetical protein
LMAHWIVFVPAILDILIGKSKFHTNLKAQIKSLLAQKT